jgi:hypothetical protein
MTSVKADFVPDVAPISGATSPYSEKPMRSDSGERKRPHGASVLKVDADEDGNGGDDAADCLRYLVATKSRVVA